MDHVQESIGEFTPAHLHGTDPKDHAKFTPTLEISLLEGLITK
jgi:hypothetical protein